MITLRSYQSRFIAEIRDAFKLGYKHVAGYLPQGGGKGVVVGFMALGAASRKNKVLILTHREEILKQNMEKMASLGLKVQVVNRHSIKLDPDADCYCSMAQTVSARIKKHENWMDWLKTITFTIVDEMHRGEMDNVLSNINKDSYIVGLSASILRSGNSSKQLGRFYDCIVTGSSTKELIGLKYLTPSKNYTFQAPKLDDISIDKSTGDYNSNKLSKVFSKPERYGGIIENYNRLTPGTKAVVFTTSANHCVDLCMAFNEAGIKSKYILSEKKPDTDKEYSGERSKLLADFRSGEFQVIVNVSILDTGWDEPSVKTVILDMSTKSYSKYSQSIGRGSRLLEGKEYFNVLDFGGNIWEHGIYEREDPPMGLWHDTTKGGVMATKECPICRRLIPISASDCPYCEYHYPTEREIYEVELQEYVDNSIEYTSVESWVAKKVLEGKSNNWILMQVCIRNSNNKKQAFMEALPYLRKANGGSISPQYWHFFSKNILRNKVK